MSHHLLHVLKHGAFLAKERGFVLCKVDEQIIGRMPLEDIRALIIAAKGISLSSSLISAILENNGIILHCDENYQPCGVSSALARTVDKRALFSQADRSLKIHSKLWDLILRAKIKNQASLLVKIACPSSYLEYQAQIRNPSESNSSARYWKIFFAKLGEKGLSRRNDDDAPLNHKLNYGYAVLGALIHRAIIAHGLNPLFGCHHKPRPDAHPLVYDLIEPLRPFCDFILYNFETSQEDKDMKCWAKYLANNLAEIKIIRKKCRIKLIDAVDIYVSSYANALAERKISNLWIPKLEDIDYGEPLQNGLVVGNV